MPPTDDLAYGDPEPTWDLLARVDRPEGVIESHATIERMKDVIDAILGRGEIITDSHFLGERPKKYSKDLYRPDYHNSTSK